MVRKNRKKNESTFEKNESGGELIRIQLNKDEKLGKGEYYGRMFVEGEKEFYTYLNSENELKWT